MREVIGSAWALLLGMGLLMVGNGLQGTLLGVRGGIEGFSTTALSIVMSGYFAGFLLGSRMVPEMIKRVGHVRVFAALGSFVSAGLINSWVNIGTPSIWFSNLMPCQWTAVPSSRPFSTSMLTRSPRRTRSSGPGIDRLKPSMDVALLPVGRSCCDTTSALSNNVSWAAKVGSGKSAVADTVAKKCRLFICSLMLARLDAL